MMFLVGFDLIFYNGKMRKVGRENKMKTQPCRRTITFFTTYSIVNMVLGNIWPIKYANRKA